MAPIKLHGMALSPNVIRVAAVLNEMGLDFEILPVDLRTGAHKHPDFLALNVTPPASFDSLHRFWTEILYSQSNFPRSAVSFLQPFGQIPALQDGDEVLYGN
jgi:glutathione S-transferase